MLFKELIERLESEKESLKARLEIDERKDGVISSQSAKGAPGVVHSLVCGVVDALIASLISLSAFSPLHKLNFALSNLLNIEAHWTDIKAPNF
jgi:hypothetical protein